MSKSRKRKKKGKGGKRAVKHCPSPLSVTAQGGTSQTTSEARQRTPALPEPDTSMEPSSTTTVRPPSGLTYGRIFLQVFAAFVITQLIRDALTVKEFLYVPYRIDSIPEGRGVAWYLAWGTYAAYVVNVFRQVLSFGIMADDPRFLEQVRLRQSPSEQIQAFLSLIAVLLIPLMLLFLVHHREHTLVTSLPFMNTRRLNLAPTIWMLAAYLLTAASFYRWDTVTQPHSNVDAGAKRRRWSPFSRAKNYTEFTFNWKYLARIAMLVAGLGLALSIWILLTASDLSDTQRASFLLFSFLLVVTVGYTLADFWLNLDFYFEDLQAPGGNRNA